MTILTVQHNGTSQATNALPANTTFATIRDQAKALWPEISNADILVNGSRVNPSDTVGSVASGSTLTFSLPTGSKA